MTLPFSSLVAQGLQDRGLTLRAFCRAAELDPSFFSKVLSGKRSPPSEESVLRRIAELLGLNAAELIVSAGRIPMEWRALWEDPELLRDIHARMTGETPEGVRPSPPSGRAWGAKGETTVPKRFAEKRRSLQRPVFSSPRKDLAEELL